MTAPTATTTASAPTAPTAPAAPAAPADPTKRVRDKIKTDLEAKAALPFAVNIPDAALLLAMVDHTTPDDVGKIFLEYLDFGGYYFAGDRAWTGKADRGAMCLGSRLMPPVCLDLRGSRGIDTPTLQRLFVADVAWLFYFEQMGIFRLAGALLDDFAIIGKVFASGNTSTAAILELMVRQTKMGLASFVRDRDSTYRRVLGWTSDAGRSDGGRREGAEPEVNAKFSAYFLKFIQWSLTYYQQKRQLDAVRGVASITTAPPSYAVVTAIKAIVGELTKYFKPFEYGRNYIHTLAGITSVIATLDLVKNMRQDLGIPPSLSALYEFMDAALEKFSPNGTAAQAPTSRFTAHKECADNARAILLALEVVPQSEEDLKLWLDIVEPYVERYRAAYQTQWGVDLAVQTTTAFKHQV